MSRRVQVMLVDDLDGGPAAETISFGLDGKSFEIDLSDRNAKQLRRLLSVYISPARRVGGVASRRSRSSGRTQTAEIKAWADTVGKTYPKRGRLPRSLVDEYATANR